MKRFPLGIFKAVKSRVFSHILICYVIILAVLASICVFSFFHARKASYEAITERNRLVLENTAKNIENVLQVIESFNGSLYTNKKLQSFMCEKDSKSALYDAYLLINELPELFDSTRLITGYFIYVPGSEYIISHGQGFTNIDRYYPYHFALKNTQSYEQWRKEVLLSNETRFYAGYPENPDSIQYATLLSSRIVGVEPGRAVYRLSGNRLLEMLTRSFSDTAQYAAIEDKYGNILCASEGYTSLDEKNYTRVESVIASGELKATILVSNRLISSQAAESVFYSLIVLAWMMGLGLLLIIITAAANMKPLMNIASRAEEMGGKAKGMWKINEAFAHAEEQSKELLNTLSLQKEFLKNACVHRLIHGNGPDGASLEEMLSNAGIAIKGSRFYAVIICLDEENEPGHVQALELEVLKRFSDRLIVLALESEKTTLAMYSESEEEPDGRKSFFTDIYNTLKESANIETAFYIGPVCESLDNLSDSFATAAWLRSTSAMDTWLNLSDSVSEDEDLSSILTETEQGQLQGKVLAGDIEGVRAQLTAIENDYFIKRSTHGFKRQYIFCRLVEVLVSAGSSLGITEELPADLMLMHSAEFFQWILERLNLLCEEAGNRLRIKSHQLGEKVFRYIEEHYDDYALTLSSLSAHLKVTGPYLSGLFKKQTGTNFSVYLEKVRISHAEELLRSEDISVDELAQKVGYISADSFRRAFKRVKGVSPTQFRESM